MTETRRARTPVAQENPTGLVADPVNRRLLEELLANPRMSMSALARAVGMSAPAVTERVLRLERAGVIGGWRMVLDPAALGLNLSAFVRLRPRPGMAGRLQTEAEATPQVTECHHITGEDCFLLRVYVASVDELGQVLERLAVCGETTSSVVLTSPIPGRPLPLPPAF
jgi:Lrp/AsnC family leucine-responsive transcriptional regulator